MCPKLGNEIVRVDPFTTKSQLPAKGRVVADSAFPLSYPGGVGYIIPPMPPIPPSMPPPPIEAGSGLSATMASVVKRSAAIEAAF